MYISHTLSTIADGVNVFFAGGYEIYKAALPLVDVMYITEIHTFVENGDAFFPEFDAGDFDVIIVETLGEKIKYTRTVYRRKNKGLWQFYLISAVKERGQYTQKHF